MVYDDTHFVFGNKSEWAEKNWGQNYSVCRNCSERQVCNIEEVRTVTCTFNECLAPPVVDDAELLGNKYTIGSRLRYRCINDKTKKSDGIVCQTNGTWSTVDFTCQEPATAEKTTCLIDSSKTPLNEHWDAQCHFAVVENKVSKDVSMTDCTKGGGKLVQILNDDKMIVLKRLLIGNGKKYWIDAQRVNINDSPWQTKGGTPVSVSESYWRLGSDNEDDKICAHLHAENNDLHLHACKCDDKLEFICERRYM